MSDFQELIRSFPKTREYVRDFFVYGFKNRNEFTEKSPRTYDNERRRLESWLAPYVQKDYVSGGANISLAIDSNLLDTNPLFQVWKTKSFTDNDIVLHFLLLDLLRDGSPRTVEEITDGLLAGYEALFDVQTVRRKCNDYEKEGLLCREKVGKRAVFSLDTSLALWLKANENALDALSFYQMAGIFGIVGNELSQQLDHQNRSFRVKHSFFVHTLEDEILYALLGAMRRKEKVRLEMKSSRKENINTASCVPLQIFVSARSGRRFLCGYVAKSRRFTCFRLDSIRRVTVLKQTDGSALLHPPAEQPEQPAEQPEQPAGQPEQPEQPAGQPEQPDYDDLSARLARNRKYLWGVSFQGTERTHLEKLSMTVQIAEPDEQYIIDRLKREGRGGSVTKTAPGIYVYENEVFDCNEMLPWIRTFTGRILSLKCSAASVERRFQQDLQTMYQMYHIDGT